MLKTDESNTAMIIRDGFPTIIDTEDGCVKWLSERYKKEEVGVEGPAPECWEKYFPTPIAEVHEEALTSCVEPVSVNP